METRHPAPTQPTIESEKPRASPYQLSLLQLMVAMSVLAFLIWMNLPTIRKVQTADGRFTITSKVGFPFSFTLNRTFDAQDLVTVADWPPEVGTMRLICLGINVVGGAFLIYCCIRITGRWR